jgi:hypothetical protein
MSVTERKGAQWRREDGQRPRLFTACFFILAANFMNFPRSIDMAKITQKRRSKKVLLWIQVCSNLLQIRRICGKPRNFWFKIELFLFDLESSADLTSPKVELFGDFDDVATKSPV